MSDRLNNEWARLCANWTRNVALRIAHEEHLPIHIACPPVMMVELIKFVMDGKVSEVVAKREAPELFRKFREWKRDHR